MAERELNTEETIGVVDRVRNLYTHLFGGGFADLSRTPSEIIHESTHCIVRHYIPEVPVDPDKRPVLLVPPQGPPATCMDLYRDNSMAAYFMLEGRPTYLVDYGSVSTKTDQEFGLDFWIDDVIPTAVETVSAHNNDAEVMVVGWCLGGILALFTQAAHKDVPIAAVGCVGSPFDFTKLDLYPPVKLLGNITDGKLESSVIRVMGGVPGKLNGLAFKFADPVRLLQKPNFVRKATKRPEILAQLEAVDAMMDTYEAYPGRSFLQIYRNFVRSSKLKEGRMHLGGERELTLEDVDVPVMNVGGSADNIFAPMESVEHLANLVPNAPRAIIKEAPGGHMGVMAGPHAKETTWPYLEQFLEETEAQLDRSFGEPAEA